MSSEIKQEIFTKLEEFMKKNEFCLTESTGYSAKPGYLDLKKGTPIKGLKRLNFLTGSAIYSDPEKIYTNFINKLKIEISSWEDDLFLNLYENSRSADVNSILSEIDNALKFVTHPLTLDKITKKTIKNYSKKISNEEKFYIYFEKVMAHPYWADKQDFLKQFLIDTKHLVTLNELFPDFAQMDINKVKSSILCSYEINFSLMPTSKFNQERNYSPHTFASMSAFVGAMIRSFHTFNPDNSPVEGICASHVTPKNGIKKITFLAEDEYLAGAFADIFFDLLKKHLTESHSVSEKSSTGIDSESIKEILERTQIMAKHNRLDQNLIIKESKTSSKKL